MKQHMIDLMPADLRQQCQAGARKGQTLVAFTLAGAALVALVTHSTLERNSKRQELSDAKAHAAQVLKLDKQKVENQRALFDDQQALQLYERIAHPLPVGSVIASVVNELPESVSLDSIELDAGARRRSTSARNARHQKDTGPVPRRLTCELAGFAVSDTDIAELVERLQGLPPLQKVSIDFTRTRMVRGKLAREFRLSFMVDLDMNYDVVERHASAGGDS